MNKQDWFFSCHFWCDPVMPGSLGVESMFECIEMFCIEQNLASKLKHPRFTHGVGKTNWKYRGQLTPRNDRMDSEVHIRDVKVHADGSVDIVADGYLYVDSLRVYSTEMMRVKIVEGTPGVSRDAARVESKEDTAASVAARRTERTESFTESKGEGKIVLQNEIEYQRRRAKEYIAAGNPPPIWDYDDLLEYAEGDIAKVYGPEYAIIDTYRGRVRMPQREYLLCSRVTKLDARTNEYGVAHISTEYDLPINGELSEGGDVPWAILVESGQADLMLISYQGVDFQCKGDRVYRLLDTTLTFYGVAHEGETLCYDIKINSHSYRPGTKEIMMFFFEYNCYVNGRLLIEMRNGVAGFFTDQELDEGKGIIHAPARAEGAVAHQEARHDAVPRVPCQEVFVFRGRHAVPIHAWKD